MTIRLSVGLKKNGTIVVVTSNSRDAIYPRTAANLQRLEQYLATLPTYERRSSTNPEFDEVINFDGYFNWGDWTVDGYLNFTHEPEPLDEHPDALVLTRQDVRNITTDEFAIGMKIYVLDVSKLYPAFDPHQPVRYYGEIIAVGTGEVTVRFDDGEALLHTFRGSVTRWYVQRQKAVA